MSILIITPLFPPAPGGAAAYFGQIARILAAKSEFGDVVVLTERQPSSPVEPTDHGRVTLLRLLPPRVTLRRARRAYQLVSYAHTQIWFAYHLRNLVRRFQIDLIHFHTRYRGRLLYRALAMCPVPVIADLRDQMTNPSNLVRVADHLLCCGEAVHTFASTGGFPPERATLLPIPFACPKVPEAQQVRDVRTRFRLPSKYLLFVGDITATKGVYDLLQAYRIWKSEHSDGGLVLAGTNREGKQFERKIATTPGAVYVGSVPTTDAIALMAGAEVLVLPSRSEGLPRVILEALAVGTKVVCPPGIPEFEHYLPNQVLTDVSPEAIARTIDQVQRSNLNCAYPFGEHNADRVVERLGGVYRQYLGQNSPGAERGGK